MAGTEKPDYAKAVDITTRGALRQMILPGLLVHSFLDIIIEVQLFPNDPYIASCINFYLVY